MTVYFSRGAAHQEIKSITFSGGELHVTTKDELWPIVDSVMVATRLQSSDDIMELVLATDLLRDNASHKTAFALVIPYFPYARQDRRTDHKTAFSLKAFANIINNLKYDSVTVYDPHSDVVPALIDKCEVIHQHNIIKMHKELDKWIKENSPVIIAPDAGATKKAWLVAKQYDLPFVTAEKHRDTTTGQISGVSLNLTGSLTGENTALIVDDICDGGGTFIPLAFALQQKGFTKIALYVTHGIFSKGFSVFNGYIEHLFSTNTFLTSSPHFGGDPTLSIGKVCPAVMEESDAD